MLTKFKLLILLSASFLFLNSCNTPNSNSDEVSDTVVASSTFFVGSYTNGKSEGIYKYELSSTGELKKIGLVAKTENPSFLCLSKDKQFLLAVNENEKGTLESYSISEDSLLFINKNSTGGANPCFVAINDENYILTANYTSGNVGLFRLSPKGKLSERLYNQQHEGKGTTARQEGPHAHSAWFQPQNKGVIAIDLGTNELWISKLNEDSSKLVLQNKLMMNEGAGPRHLCFHPNGKWIYVVNELNSTVSLVEKNENNHFELKESISTLPEDYKGDNACADIHISSDGKFVYASNRGHNSIAIFQVMDNGRLKYLQYEPTKGDGPRNFSFSLGEKYLVVANQNTNNIVSFQRDEETGLLNFVDEVESFSPVCIAFYE